MSAPGKTNKAYTISQLNTPPSPISGAELIPIVQINNNIPDTYKISLASISTILTGVISFNGRTGIVIPAAGDYSFSEIAGLIATSQLPTNSLFREVSFSLDGQGSPITALGTWYLAAVPFNGTITAWNMVADTSGSIVVDVWKTATGSVPTIANTITAGASPTLSGAQAAFNGSVAGWTTAVLAGDVFAFHVNSAATLTKLSLTLSITIT